MKAVAYTRYGPPEVLRVIEVPKPSPGPGEVLVRTGATTVTSGDWRVRSLSMPVGFRTVARLMFGVSGPRQPILGSEIAGTIEQIGEGVTQFRPGDEVFAFSGASLGCYSQHKCFRETGLIIKKPKNLTIGEAATLSFAGTTALDFFRKAGLSEGERVLVNGASGAVGAAAIQIAKQLGAEVTGVSSGGNLDLVRRLGADRVVDYTRQDFAEMGSTYDVIMDTAGTAPYAKSKGCLSESGRLLLVLGGLPDMLRAPWVSLSDTRRIIAGAAAERRDDLLTLAQMAEAGQLRPVIDRTYPVSEIVEAHRYVDTGRKRGSVVVTWD